MCNCVFTVRVQFYRPLLPSENPIAVNIISYHIISYIISYHISHIISLIISYHISYNIIYHIYHINISYHAISHHNIEMDLKSAMGRSGVDISSSG